jgi:IPT/TIG domain
MANARGGDSGDVPALYLCCLIERAWTYRSRALRVTLEVLAVTLLLSTLAFAQAAPRIMNVQPSSGKVNDNITLTGDKLGKDSVSGVFLSDEKDDFKALVMEQTNSKIIIKVPQVKAGNYNISLQVGDQIFIEPVRFRVQQ